MRLKTQKNLCDVFNFLINLGVMITICLVGWALIYYIYSSTYQFPVFLQGFIILGILGFLLKASRVNWGIPTYIFETSTKVGGHKR